MTNRPSIWTGTGLTNQGRVRSANQDAYGVLNETRFWLVADGMGGRVGGEVASRIAVESVAKSLISERRVETAAAKDVEKTSQRLRAAVQSANGAIRAEAGRRPQLLGMGTTLVVLAIVPEPDATAVIANIGDSRAYLLRNGTLMPLTKDHSVVEESIRTGLLSEAEASVHPLRHVLTRALGTELEVEPDITVCPLDSEDVLLLCTDGLTKMARDSRIREILATYRQTPGQACERLIEAANDAGGDDNITVVIVRNDLTKSA
jgi:serine/threonine protein phosphatase PrpC